MYNSPAQRGALNSSNSSDPRGSSSSTSDLLSTGTLEEGKKLDLPVTAEQGDLESQTASIGSSTHSLTGGGTASRDVPSTITTASSVKEHLSNPNDNLGMSPDLFAKTMKIGFAVAFYFVISISLVFLNKAVISGASNFNFPIFVTWVQLLVALGLLFVLGILGQTMPAYFSYFQPYEFNLDIAKKVLPLSLIFVGMVTFNNLCLLYVEISFYQVARSLSICFSILFTYIILSQPTSRNALLCSGIVFVGFVLGSFSEIKFSTIGLIYGVISSVFVAGYGIAVKKFLPIVNRNEQRLIMYNTTLSLGLLVPLIFLFGEYVPLLNHPLTYDANNWMVMILTGITGFLLNIATYLQIKVTSPLTNTISGTAKACVQTIISVYVYSTQVPFLNGLGIFLVIVGSFLYSYVRHLEMR